MAPSCFLFITRLGSASGPRLRVREPGSRVLVLVITGCGLMEREQKGQPGTDPVGAKGAHSSPQHVALRSPRYHLPKHSSAFPALMFLFVCFVSFFTFDIIKIMLSSGGNLEDVEQH